MPTAKSPGFKFLSGKAIFLMLFLPVAFLAPCFQHCRAETFGYTGASTDFSIDINDRKRGGLYTAPGGGVGDSIYFYLWEWGEDPVVKFALYKESDSSLVDSTSELMINLQGNGWIGAAFQNAPTIYADTVYVITCWADDAPAGSDVAVQGHDATGQSWWYGFQTYGAWPSKWTSISATYADQNLNCYVVFSSGEPPAAKRRRRAALVIGSEP
jgi:hypothetical protein